CTGNGARSLYYVWERIVTHTDDRLHINLLLNRASPWGDVDSHLPYAGQVDVKVKVSCKLAVRLPEWIHPTETRRQVNGGERPVPFAGRYAEVGPVGPGDVATLTFPIAERTETMYVEKDRYTVIRKGNEVVFIDPPGRYCPLYQRDHYRENATRW